MFEITRKFTAGALEGVEFTEKTSVEFRVGQVVSNPIGCSPYIVTAVKKVED